MDPAEEKMLVARAQDGDSEALEELFCAHRDNIVGIFLKNLDNNEALANELAQDTMLKAHKSIATFEGRSLFRTWLRRIAVNVLRDHFRSQARQVPTQPFPAEVSDDRPDSNPATMVEQQELIQRCRHAKEHLSDHLRFVIESFYGDLNEKPTLENVAENLRKRYPAECGHANAYYVGKWKQEALTAIEQHLTSGQEK